MKKINKTVLLTELKYLKIKCKFFLKRVYFLIFEKERKIYSLIKKAFLYFSLIFWWLLFIYISISFSLNSGGIYLILASSRIEVGMLFSFLLVFIIIFSFLEFRDLIKWIYKKIRNKKRFY